MRYNDREIAKLGDSKSEIEGILHHMKPQNNDWSDWYQQPSFKERYFKLKSNLLYYYRVNEQEPLGVLVLENTQVAYERPHKGIPFAFSITFKVNDKLRDTESKHIFSCRCQDDVNKWVSSLKSASYEYWRSQYVILKTKISMKTGKDPVLDYMRSKTESSTESGIEKTETVVEVKETNGKHAKKSTFYSHIEQQTSSFFKTSSSSCQQTRVVKKSEKVAVENLIDL